MRIPNRRRFLFPLLALVASASPFTLDAKGGGVVRLQQACGQATACEKSSAYICSRAEADYQGYKCSKGCVAPQ